ncbi:short-chain fatty acyl-CoA regulator family protein [Giesbergeria sinuosa]
MGIKLRKLRAERGMSQIALAQAMGISPSYLNQLEQNQRPFTVSVLLKLNRAMGIDIQEFSEDEEARLLAGLKEALAEAAQPISLPEFQEVASQMPALAQAVIALHRRQHELIGRLESLSLQLGDGRNHDEPMISQPFELVRDFFFSHQNYFDPLDRAAEGLAQQAQAKAPSMKLDAWLEQRLETHGVKVQRDRSAQRSKRHFDPVQFTLTLSAHLEPPQQSFQMATQLALMEFSSLIDDLIKVPPFTKNEPARKLVRVGLANYFAGALLLPYMNFLQAAETLRYDIELLGQLFGVGLETVCHRLSTLQRLGSPGVPFFFVRVDRAGNISKRQSATHFHFSRIGGTCPLWNVYEAFSRPGQILAQLSSMPDGRRYLWIAHTVTHGEAGYGAPRRTFSVGLGCDVRHAHRLVYAKGLDLQSPEAATPIGMGCKVCEREDCPQRAFPFVGRALAVDENQSQSAPYGSLVGQRAGSQKLQ